MATTPSPPIIWKIKGQEGREGRRPAGGAHGAPARKRSGVQGPRERPSRGVGRSPVGGAHGAPARKRSGVQGAPRATEPGCGAEPHVNKEALMPDGPAGITVAISRQRGSGGSYVGRQVAHCLNLKYIDRELLRDAAEYLHHEESSRTPRKQAEASWWSHLGNALALGGPEILYVPPSPAAVYEGDLFEREDCLIREIVTDHVAVIVGRGVAQLLRNRREVVTVFVHAPERWRADRIRQVYGVADAASALRMVQESDRERAKFLRR